MEQPSRTANLLRWSTYHDGQPIITVELVAHNTGLDTDSPNKSRKLLPEDRANFAKMFCN
uniref:Uncharacterized protein n=1 Tax=Romanomermis culicivorax TaxID=13658 RepID=A0A915I7V1_ROMCU